MFTPALSASVRPVLAMRCCRRIAGSGDSKRSEGELVYRTEELGRIAVDAIRPGLRELFLAVAAAQEADAEHARAPRASRSTPQSPIT